MVDEKRGWGKKYFLIAFSAVMLLTIISLVSAAYTINSPITWGNWSTTLDINITYTITTVNCSLGIANCKFNVTFYCNKSGGSVHNRVATDKVATIWNVTSSTATFNATGLSTTGPNNNNITRVDIATYTDIFGDYNCSAYADNGSANNLEGDMWSVAVKNITIDNTAPAVVFSGITRTVSNNVVNNANYTRNLVLILNVSVIDTTIGMNGGTVYFNISNASGQLNWTIASNYTSNYYNRTFVSDILEDGVYNLTVWANDSLNNLDKTTHIQFTVDGTAPTAAFACSPSTVTSSGIVDCVCTPTDNLAGVNYTAGSISYTPHPSVGSLGTFTLTCSFSDTAGNTGNQTTSYTVILPDSSGAAVITPSTTAPVKEKVNSWDKIAPGTTAVVTDFSADSGIEEIQIQVSQTASNVKLTVNRYESAPTTVATAKTYTYKYLQIDTQNLADKLSKAVIQIKVDKSWISENNLDKEDVALFKYDETDDKWNELTTTYKSEDSSYYYYDTEVTSFSYFAIAPKAAAAEKVAAGEEQPTGMFLGLPSWVWILILAGILAIFLLVKFVILKKKR
jgi:PGF-pre-PGF domain-containing protein